MRKKSTTSPHSINLGKSLKTNFYHIFRGHLPSNNLRGKIFMFRSSITKIRKSVGLWKPSLIFKKITILQQGDYEVGNNPP